MAKSNLVIVESPAKAKTIGKYLGPDYKVLASMGHVRDLPKSKMGVDLEHNDFEPDYQPIKGKEETIAELQEAADKSKKVYLHLPEEKTSRVTFNEITKKVVTDSIAHPRDIDQNLVDAQQARRILDRIVGYQLSPLLWKKIRRGLSAGRVQSVATRLVAEREEEIRAFVPEEYWTLEVTLDRVAPNIGSFKTQFYGREKKMELKSKEQVDEVLDAIRTAPFSVSKIKRQDKSRSPAPPFITSTLQQEASRKLNMSPRRTMSIAQQLYEGVDIAGEGTVGLITYMRTDSLRLSDEAVAAARSFAGARYGQEYLPDAPRHFKAKAGAQDAHEAIRPSNVALTPESIKKDLTAEQFRLYKLIWSRFLACQMANAIYDSVNIEVTSAGYVFKASRSEVKFPGFLAVYEEGKDEEGGEIQSRLPNLQEGEPLVKTAERPEQKFTQPPTRYTEATLIRALEEKGIGRPSTYAPTITTIMNREYVVKDGKYLHTTPLVTFESIDMDSAWFASRYDKGTADYINCPLSQEEYLAFWKELREAQEAPVHGFEDKNVFEGCMPVEVMARRGEQTLCFGPLKPRGLPDPKTGKEPYAVVQLRRDNAMGSVYNLVGFQTHLTWPEQKRVFSMIPALKHAEFLRYGVMHRNTYLNAPKLLDRYYRVKGDERLMFAGQITGVEGYVESTASGCLAALELARRIEGKPPIDFPQETAIGALALYISHEGVENFQPMNVNFGIMPPLGYRVKGKRNKNAALSQRALEALDGLDWR